MIKMFLLVKSQFDELTQLFKNASILHESLLHIMPSDEKDNQTIWFSSIIKYNRGFIEDVKIWLSEVGKCSSRPVGSTFASVQPLETPLGGEMGAQENIERRLRFLFYLQHDVQDDVLPSDSVSSQGSRSSSRISTMSSARLRAEAEMAALLARQRMLKDKHTLEEQEEQLRRKKEQLQLEADIAATVAKVNVLRTGSTARSASLRKTDGMESYFKAKEKTLEILIADAETFVLQKLNGNTKGNANIGNVAPRENMVQQSVKRDKSVPLLKGPSNSLRQCSTIPHLPLEQRTSHPISSENQYVLSIMEKQNELTSMLVHQQNLSSLSRREIPSLRWH